MPTMSGRRKVERVQDVISALQKNFECPICLELIRTPVATRCDHKFCRHCILETIGRRTSAPCPLCKETFTKRSLQPLEQWAQMVNGVRKMMEAFQRDTGIAFSSTPNGTTLPGLTPSKKSKKEQEVKDSSVEAQPAIKIKECQIYIDDVANTSVPTPCVKTNINISSSFPSGGVKEKKGKHQKSSRLSDEGGGCVVDGCDESPSVSLLKPQERARTHTAVKLHPAEIKPEMKFVGPTKRKKIETTVIKATNVRRRENTVSVTECKPSKCIENDREEPGCVQYVEEADRIASAAPEDPVEILPNMKAESKVKSWLQEVRTPSTVGPESLHLASSSSSIGTQGTSLTPPSQIRKPRRIRGDEYDEGKEETLVSHDAKESELDSIIMDCTEFIKKAKVLAHQKIEGTIGRQKKKSVARVRMGKRMEYVADESEEDMSKTGGETHIDNHSIQDVNQMDTEEQASQSDHAITGSVSDHDHLHPEISEFRVLATSSTTEVVEDAAKSRNSRISVHHSHSVGDIVCYDTDPGKQNSEACGSRKTRSKHKKQASDRLSEPETPGSSGGLLFRTPVIQKRKLPVRHHKDTSHSRSKSSDDSCTDRIRDPYPLRVRENTIPKRSYSMADYKGRTEDEKTMSVFGKKTQKDKISGEIFSDISQVHKENVVDEVFGKRYSRKSSKGTQKSQLSKKSPEDGLKKMKKLPKPGQFVWVDDSDEYLLEVVKKNDKQNQLLDKTKNQTHSSVDLAVEVVAESQKPSQFKSYLKECRPRRNDITSQEGNNADSDMSHDVQVVAGSVRHTQGGATCEKIEVEEMADCVIVQDQGEEGVISNDSVNQINEMPSEQIVVPESIDQVSEAVMDVPEEMLSQKSLAACSQPDSTEAVGTIEYVSLDLIQKLHVVVEKITPKLGLDEQVVYNDEGVGQQDVEPPPVEEQSHLRSSATTQNEGGHSNAHLASVTNEKQKPTFGGGRNEITIPETITLPESAVVMETRQNSDNEISATVQQTAQEDCLVVKTMVSAQDNDGARCDDANTTQHVNISSDSIIGPTSQDEDGPEISNQSNKSLSRAKSLLTRRKMGLNKNKNLKYKKVGLFGNKNPHVSKSISRGDMSVFDISSDSVRGPTSEEDMIAPSVVNENSRKTPQKRRQLLLKYKGKLVRTPKTSRFRQSMIGSPSEEDPFAFKPSQKTPKKKGHKRGRKQNIRKAEVGSSRNSSQMRLNEPESLEPVIEIDETVETINVEVNLPENDNSLEVNVHADGDNRDDLEGNDVEISQTQEEIDRMSAHFEEAEEFEFVFSQQVRDMEEEARQEQAMTISSPVGGSPPPPRRASSRQRQQRGPSHTENGTSRQQGNEGNQTSDLEILYEESSRKLNIENTSAPEFPSRSKSKGTRLQVKGKNRSSEDASKGVNAQNGKPSSRNTQGMMQRSKKMLALLGKSKMLPPLAKKDLDDVSPKKEWEVMKEMEQDLVTDARKRRLDIEKVASQRKSRRVTSKHLCANSEERPEVEEECHITDQSQDSDIQVSQRWLVNKYADSDEESDTGQISNSLNNTFSIDGIVPVSCVVETTLGDQMEEERGGPNREASNKPLPAKVQPQDGSQKDDRSCPSVKQAATTVDSPVHTNRKETASLLPGTQQNSPSVRKPVTNPADHIIPAETGTCSTVRENDDSAQIDIRLEGPGSQQPEVVQCSRPAGAENIVKLIEQYNDNLVTSDLDEPIQCTGEFTTTTHTERIDVVPATSEAGTAESGVSRAELVGDTEPEIQCTGEFQPCLEEFEYEYSGDGSHVVEETPRVNSQKASASALVESPAVNRPIQTVTCTDSTGGALLTDGDDEEEDVRCIAESVEEEEDLPGTQITRKSVDESSGRRRLEASAVEKIEGSNKEAFSADVKESSEVHAGHEKDGVTESVHRPGASQLDQSSRKNSDIRDDSHEVTMDSPTECISNTVVDLTGIIPPTEKTRDVGKYRLRKQTSRVNSAHSGGRKEQENDDGEISELNSLIPPTENILCHTESMNRRSLRKQKAKKIDSSQCKSITEEENNEDISVDVTENDSVLSGQGSLSPVVIPDTRSTRSQRMTPISGAKYSSEIDHEEQSTAPSNSIEVGVIAEGCTLLETPIGSVNKGDDSVKFADTESTEHGQVTKTEHEESDQAKSRQIAKSVEESCDETQNLDMVDTKHTELMYNSSEIKASSSSADKNVNVADPEDVAVCGNVSTQKARASDTIASSSMGSSSPVASLPASSSTHHALKECRVLLSQYDATAGNLSSRICESTTLPAEDQASISRHKCNESSQDSVISIRSSSESSVVCIPDSVGQENLGSSTQRRKKSVDSMVTSQSGKEDIAVQEVKTALEDSQASISCTLQNEPSFKKKKSRSKRGRRSFSLEKSQVTVSSAELQRDEAVMENSGSVGASRVTAGEATVDVMGGASIPIHALSVLINSTQSVSSVNDEQMHNAPQANRMNVVGDTCDAVTDNDCMVDENIQEELRSILSESCKKRRSKRLTRSSSQRGESCEVVEDSAVVSEGVSEVPSTENEETAASPGRPPRGQKSSQSTQGTEIIEPSGSQTGDSQRRRSLRSRKTARNLAMQPDIQSESVSTPGNSGKGIKVSNHQTKQILSQNNKRNQRNKEAADSDKIHIVSLDSSDSDSDGGIHSAPTGTPKTVRGLASNTPLAAHLRRSALYGGETGEMQRAENTGSVNSVCPDSEEQSQSILTGHVGKSKIASHNQTTQQLYSVTPSAVVERKGSTNDSELTEENVAAGCTRNDLPGMPINHQGQLYPGHTVRQVSSILFSGKNNDEVEESSCSVVGEKGIQTGIEEPVDVDEPPIPVKQPRLSGSQLVVDYTDVEVTKSTTFGTASVQLMDTRSATTAESTASDSESVLSQGSGNVNASSEGSDDEEDLAGSRLACALESVDSVLLDAEDEDEASEHGDSQQHQQQQTSIGNKDVSNVKSKSRSEDLNNTEIESDDIAIVSDVLVPESRHSTMQLEPEDEDTIDTSIMNVAETEDVDGECDGQREKDTGSDQEELDFVPPTPPVMKPSQSLLLTQSQCLQQHDTFKIPRAPVNSQRSIQSSLISVKAKSNQNRKVKRKLDTCSQRDVRNSQVSQSVGRAVGTVDESSEVTVVESSECSVQSESLIDDGDIMLSGIKPFSPEQAPRNNQSSQALTQKRRSRKAIKLSNELRTSSRPNRHISSPSPYLIDSLDKNIFTTEEDEEGSDKGGVSCADQKSETQHLDQQGVKRGSGDVAHPIDLNDSDEEDDNGAEKHMDSKDSAVAAKKHGRESDDENDYDIYGRPRKPLIHDSDEESDDGSSSRMNSSTVSSMSEAVDTQYGDELQNDVGSLMKEIADLEAKLSAKKPKVLPSISDIAQHQAEDEEEGDDLLPDIEGAGQDEGDDADGAAGRRKNASDAVVEDADDEDEDSDAEADEATNADNRGNMDDVENEIDEQVDAAASQNVNLKQDDNDLDCDTEEMIPDSNESRSARRHCLLSSRHSARIVSPRNQRNVSSPASRHLPKMAGSQPPEKIKSSVERRGRSKRKVGEMSGNESSSEIPHVASPRSPSPPIHLTPKKKSTSELNLPSELTAALKILKKYKMTPTLSPLSSQESVAGFDIGHSSSKRKRSKLEDVSERKVKKNKAGSATSTQLNDDNSNNEAYPHATENDPPEAVLPSIEVTSRKSRSKETSPIIPVGEPSQQETVKKQTSPPIKMEILPDIDECSPPINTALSDQEEGSTTSRVPRLQFSHLGKTKVQGVPSSQAASQITVDSTVSRPTPAVRSFDSPRQQSTSSVQSSLLSTADLGDGQSVQIKTEPDAVSAGPASVISSADSSRILGHVAVNKHMGRMQQNAPHTPARGSASASTVLQEMKNTPQLQRKVMSPLTQISSPGICSDIDFPKRPNWVFTSSGIKSGKVKVRLNQFAEMLDCRVIPRHTQSTTHVIVPPDPEYGDPSVCSRTLKYFQAVAGRCWLVSFQWILDSLKKGQIFPEEDYEMAGDSVKGKHEAPRRSRLAATPLLAGYEICCYGHFTDLKKDEIHGLVQMCGASIIQEPSLFSFDPSQRAVILVEDDDKKDLVTLRKINRIYSVPVVAKDWLLDTIGCYQIQRVAEWAIDLNVETPPRHSYQF